MVGFSAWRASVKARTPHGKLPVLWDYDGAGACLSQEQTITRFLAQRVGLAGRSILEQAEVDMWYAQLFCTLRNNGVSHDGEHYSVRALKELAAAEAEAGGGAEAAEGGVAGGIAVPRYQDVYRREAAQLSAAERSLSALRVFEERLEQSGSGFLVGGRITYADLALFDILFELAEPDNVPDFAAAFALPQLGAFLERIEARPKIAEYLRSARRMPRYGRNAQTGEGVYEYVPGRHAPPPSDLPAGYRYGAS